MRLVAYHFLNFGITAAFGNSCVNDFGYKVNLRKTFFDKSSRVRHMTGKPLNGLFLKITHSSLPAIF